MKKSHSPFLFIGNNLAVDFTNTEIILNGENVDLLNNKSDLAQWIKDANLTEDIKRPSTADFTDALELRAALKNTLNHKIAGTTGQRSAITVINKYLAHYPSKQVLHESDKEFSLEPAQASLTTTMLLARIAYAGASLLSSPQVKYLKRCSNSECILLFVDTSRSRQRRWCSMDTCGNRSKVATHYKKITSDHSKQG